MTQSKPEASAKSLALTTLTQAGVSSAGARQALEGHAISDPNDRQMIAGLIVDASQGKPVARWNFENAWPVK